MLPIHPRLIAIGLIVAALAGLGAYIWYLRADINRLNGVVEVERGRVQVAQQELLQATQAASALDSSLKAAEANRVSLVKSRDELLRKSKAKTPAADTACPKVIEWAIENAGDLAWEAK